MIKRKRIAEGILVAVMLMVLSGCSPATDKTDPLSDYSVNVNVPFATNSTTYQTLPPANQKYTIRPDKTETIVGWMNETMDASVKDAYTQLSLGSLGTNVKNLQKRLIELGYMQGVAGGTYDQATAQAVRLFENAYGQVETGVASPLMQVYLFADNAKTYSENKYQSTATQAPGSYTKLQKGDMGNGVASLQRRLIELGYLSGSASGIFDTNTENAVKDFEAAYGRTRTGIATESMQVYLFSSSAYPANRTTPTPTPFTPSATKTATVTYEPLQYGSKGDLVKNLQTRLKYLGYYTGKVDGVYGNGTVNAVKAFESAYGREETGVATSLMQTYLFSESAITYQEAQNKPTPTPVIYQTLSKGSYGEEVVKLQQRLIELKYLSGKADGYFGENTENAVKAFEARYGKMQTGVATPDMQRYLFASGALKNSSTQTNTQTSYVALGEGSYGTAVYALESRLTELKYMVGEPDGYYDSETANAIRAFELANGRTQTGVASVALQELLYSSKAKGNVNASSESYKTLKNGDKSDDVAKVQKRLIELGYLTGTVDGYFGDGTEAAIRAFEAAYGREQTGVATVLLQTYLFSKNAIKNPNTNVAVSYATLESGDSGQSVKELQKRLIELGYLKGTADGKYGSDTASAVKAFQKALGLKQTGVASSSLQKELFADSAPAFADTEAAFVSVNKTARVTVSSTNVYSKIGATTPIGVLYNGTEITILRTSGSWAEIKNAAGSVGYANLGDFEYVSSGMTGGAVTVNKSAIISVDQVYVYASPSESAKKLGKMSAGSAVTWLRTNGEWAEVKNSAGTVGYILKKYLTVSQASSSSSSYPSLKTGNTGENVKKIQRRLKELGYFSGDIGGNYLSKTTAAVKAFQKAIGISQTGNASSDLQEILFSAAAPRYGAYSAPEAKNYQSIGLGASGENVGELQLKLIALGYMDYEGAVYGTYGATTEKAVISLQNAMGYLNANGIASSELQAFLSSEAASVLQR